MQRLKMHPNNQLKKIFLALALICIFPNNFSAKAQSLHELIRYRIDTFCMLGSLEIAEAQIASKTVLPELYEKNQFRPFWTDAEKIEAFIKIIEASSSDGLEPEDYHYSEIQGLEAFLGSSAKQNNLIKADLDMLLTDALILLTNHLFFGKVDPKQLDPQWDFNRKINNLNPIEFLQEIISSSQLTDRIERLKPSKPIYAKLKTALARYRSISAMGRWHPLPFGKNLNSDMRNNRIYLLRQRLAVSGFLSPPGKEDNLFDDELKKAVIEFQKRHGLAADGVVGRKTIAALNIPAEKRMDQIRANLERARWSLHGLKNRYVLVDIAGFRIYFYDNDDIIWSSRVQVGRPFRRTPVFSDEISYLVLNPSWTIPPTIIVRDILPEVKEDIRFLTKHAIQILDQRGRSINPESIDWHLYPAQYFPYLLRQAPGPENAMGVIKFMFPNPYMIYIHDTPSKNLFSAKSRAFSSGCIRVENPLELAELIINNPQKWSRSELQKVVVSEKTETIYLKNPVPVLLLYWTVDVDNNGIVYFKEDIYDRDKAVIKGMKAKLTPLRK